MVEGSMWRDSASVAMAEGSCSGRRRADDLQSNYGTVVEQADRKSVV